ncbi:MAG: hypothetical protein NUV76_10615 [Candidatus Kuenenia sp.]|nr:hypothetical protein [Candidatus Kuenenia sp.]
MERKTEIQRWKDIADSFVNETDEILLKMNELTAIGLKPLDALHIACAVSLQCQYFLTVDKGILKKTTEYSEIKMAGFELLRNNLGIVEAEKFIALIQREKFDYTKWRENLFNGLSGEEISKNAMEFQQTLKNK